MGTYPKYIGRLTWIKSRQRFESKDRKVIFDPEAGSAYSYEWFKILSKVDGKLVLNKFPYSRTTQRHYSTLQHALNQLNLKVHVEVQAPYGLQKVEATFTWYQKRISDLRNQISKPRSRKSANVKREQEIASLLKEVEDYRRLLNGEIFDHELENILA